MISTINLNNPIAIVFKEIPELQAFIKACPPNNCYTEKDDFTLSGFFSHAQLLLVTKKYNGMVSFIRDPHNLRMQKIKERESMGRNKK